MPDFLLTLPEGERFKIGIPDDDKPASDGPPTIAGAMEHQRRWGMPSAAEQIPGIISQTAETLTAPLTAGPRLMSDVASGKVDPNSPEAIRRSADVALNTAGMGMMGAERGAIGALGGKGFTLDQTKFHDTGAGETLHHFNINDTQGTLAGRLAIRNRGDVLHIEWAKSEGLGTGDIRSLLTQLREQFPEAEAISGFRKTPDGELRTQTVALPKKDQGGFQPLARTVFSRDASGRPLQTKPFKTGREYSVLEAGYSHGTGTLSQTNAALGAKPERIAAPAVRIEGKIYTDQTGHHAAWEQAHEELGGNDSFDTFLEKNWYEGEAESGYVTSEGRFVGQKEARKIADKAEQTRDRNIDRDWLESSNFDR